MCFVSVLKRKANLIISTLARLGHAMFLLSVHTVLTHEVASTLIDRANAIAPGFHFFVSTWQSDIVLFLFFTVLPEKGAG